MELHNTKEEGRVYMPLKIFDIVEVDFCGNVGSEQLGVRPSVIVQNDSGNLHSPTVIVIPLTSEIKKLYIPTHKVIQKSTDNGLDSASMLLGEQIRSIDKTRIQYKRGCLSQEDEKQSVIQVYLANLTGKKNSTIAQ